LTRTTRVVISAAVLGALVWLIVLDRTVPALTRGGRPFVVPGLPAGTIVSQEFSVLVGRALRGVHVDAAVTEGEGVLDAALVELQGASGEREIRRTRMLVAPGMPDCCEIGFEPIRNSAGRRFRLDLHLESTQRLKLGVWLVPTGEKKGGLVINRRVQSANLRFDLAGAIRAPSKD
jgi:hypothetical protein